MKKFFKVFTSALLICTLIITGCPADVFASGGGDEPSGPDRSNTGMARNEGGSGYPLKYSESTNDVYILTVTSGPMTQVDIDSILIRYYTTSGADQLATQVLKPNRLDGMDTDTVYDPTMITKSGNTIYPFNGSRVLTLLPFVGKVSTVGSEGIYGEGFNYIKAEGSFPQFKPLQSYSEIAKGMMGGENVYPSAKENVEATGMNASGSTYYRFRLEYPMKEIYSISFICKGDGLADWDLLDVRLYQDNGEVSNGNFVKGSIYATNYAYISDRTGLAFGGTCIYKMTEKAKKKLPDGIGIQDCANITLYNKEARGIVDKFDPDREEPRDKSDVYGSPTVGGNAVIETLCIEPCNEDHSIGVNNAVYNFSINLADEAGAGIESLTATPLTGIAWQEMLTATIKYKTTTGLTETVRVPVLTNALMDYVINAKDPSYKATTANGTRYQKVIGGFQAMPTVVESKDAEGNVTQTLTPAPFTPTKDRILAFAQQGDSIVFSVEFPDIEVLESVSLNYKNMIDENDYIIIQDIGVYDNWGNSYNVQSANYKGNDNNSAIDLSCAVSNAGQKNNLIYRSLTGSIARDSSESSLRRKRTSTQQLDNWTGDLEFVMEDLRNAADSEKTLSQKNYEGVYLVSITTSNMPLASTEDDVYIQFDYLDNNNQEKHSSETLIRELCASYMGYMPADYVSKEEVWVGGKQVWNDDGSPKMNTVTGRRDAAYEYGMHAGKTISFFITLNNLKEFTKVRFRMEDGQDDEWQFSNLTIVRIGEKGQVGKRIINPGGACTLSASTSESSTYEYMYTFNRQVIPEAELINKTTALLITGGESRELDLKEAGSIPEGEQKFRRDYSEYKYVMDYSMACSDLKFDTAVKNYEVHVQVAHNKDSATSVDNCGSNNNFYFQLIFRNGAKSGFVLANQQLLADGFRSGQEEIFTISTNENLGDVVSIAIIPDDTSGNPDAGDKLCIEKIKVIKNNIDTINKQFVFENIGWIAPDYRDDSESTEREGHLEAEVAKYFTTSYSGFVLELEFALAIGDYDPDVPQFVGNMTMDLYYENSEGESRHITGIQVVEAMYEYIGKTPRINGEQEFSSNPDLMFRAGHIDRFTVNVEDCAMLRKAVLHGAPDDNTALKITDLAVNVLKGPGVLALNDQSEFMRLYDEAHEPIVFTQLQTPPKQSVLFQVDGKDMISLPFIEHYLTNEEINDYTEYESLITRYPESANDVLNYYLYLKPGVPAPDDGGYSLTTEMRYASVVNSRDSYAVLIKSYNTRTENGMKVLYKEGISASNFSVLQNLHLACSRINNNDLQADHAVIQQVRDGVIINTFNVAFGGNIFGRNTGLSSGSIYSTKSAGEYQRVTLQLGEGTSNAKLIKDTVDMAVALIYRTKALGGSQYTTGWTFATDDETQERVAPGTVLNFDFHETEVGDIVGIKVATMGGLKGSFSGANVKIYEPDENGNSVFTEWYSVIAPDDTEKNALSFSEKIFEDIFVGQNSTKALKKVDLTFNISGSASVADSGGSCPIRATFTYKKTDNSSASVVVDDIRNYVSLPSQYATKFSSGSSTTVSVFLPGLASLKSIRLEPYDADPENSASMNLDTLEFVTEGTEDTTYHNIPIKTRIVEGTPADINLSGTFVTLKAVGTSTVNSVVNDTVEMREDGGSKLSFIASVEPLGNGITYTVYKNSGSGDVLIKSGSCESGTAVDYTVANTHSAPVTYTFEFHSALNAAAYSKAIVTVNGFSDAGYESLSEEGKAAFDADKALQEAIEAEERAAMEKEIAAKESSIAALKTKLDSIRTDTTIADETKTARAYNAIEECTVLTPEERSKMKDEFVKSLDTYNETTKKPVLEQLDKDLRAVIENTNLIDAEKITQATRLIDACSYLTSEEKLARNKQFQTDLDVFNANAQRFAQIKAYLQTCIDRIDGLANKDIYLQEGLSFIAQDPSLTDAEKQTMQTQFRLDYEAQFSLKEAQAYAAIEELVNSTIARIDNPNYNDMSRKAVLEQLQSLVETLDYYNRFLSSEVQAANKAKLQDYISTYKFDQGKTPNFKMTTQADLGRQQALDNLEAQLALITKYSNIRGIEYIKSDLQKGYDLINAAPCSADEKTKMKTAFLNDYKTVYRSEEGRAFNSLNNTVANVVNSITARSSAADVKKKVAETSRTIYMNGFMTDDDKAWFGATLNVAQAAYERGEAAGPYTPKPSFTSYFDTAEGKALLVEMGELSHDSTDAQEGAAGIEDNAGGIPEADLKALLDEITSGFYVTNMGRSTVSTDLQKGYDLIRNLSITESQRTQLKKDFYAWYKTTYQQAEKDTIGKMNTIIQNFFRMVCTSGGSPTYASNLKNLTDYRDSTLKACRFLSADEVKINQCQIDDLIKLADPNKPLMTPPGTFSMIYHSYFENETIDLDLQDQLRTVMNKIDGVTNKDKYRNEGIALIQNKSALTDAEKETLKTQFGKDYDAMFDIKKRVTLCDLQKELDALIDAVEPGSVQGLLRSTTSKAQMLITQNLYLTQTEKKTMTSDFEKALTEHNTVH